MHKAFLCQQDFVFVKGQIYKIIHCSHPLFDKHFRGSVYQTEDDYSGLFYKFVPSQKQNLAGRGKLYALKIPGIENTSNKDGLISTGDTFPVEWVRIKDPLAESTKTKIQGKDAGASIFKGGEGIIHTNDKDLTLSLIHI